MIMLYILEFKLSGFILFNIFGLLPNLYLMYSRNTSEYYQYYSYVKNVLLAKSPSKYKTILKYFVFFTILLQLRLIHLGNIKIYFGLSIISFFVLLNLESILLLALPFTLLQYFILHVVIFFLRNKSKFRSFILWLYQFESDEDVDVFIFNAISNPHRKILEMGSALGLAGAAAYGLNLGEIALSEVVGRTSAESLINSQSGDVSIETAQRIRALEIERIHSKLPLNSAANSLNDTMHRLEFTLTKHGSAPRLEDDIKKYKLEEGLKESSEKIKLPPTTTSSSKN